MIGVCTVCKTSFKYFPSNKSGKYCSTKCSFLSPEWRLKQSETKKGRKHTQEAKQKMSIARKGKKHSLKHIERRIKTMKATKRLQRTERLKNRTGTMADYPEYRQLRLSKEYRWWRNEVLEIGGNKCKNCGARKNLEVDHIIPFASAFEEAKILNDTSLVFDLDNGQILCKKCHKKTKSYNQKSHKQIEYRLMQATKNEWQQEGSVGDFEVFYREKMEKIIQFTKNKLDT